MLIFGDRYIPSNNFIKIKSIEDIKKSSVQDILFLNDFSKPFELAKYCNENNLKYAIYANSIKDALYANALNCTFLISSLSLAKELQILANEYLWDMKVLSIIESENELETVAKAFIDGAIYKNWIKEL